MRVRKTVRLTSNAMKALEKIQAKLSQQVDWKVSMSDAVGFALIRAYMINVIQDRDDVVIDTGNWSEYLDNLKISKNSIN